MFCSNCGKPIAPGSVFCGSCGTRLNGVSPDAPAASSAPASPSSTVPYSAPATPSFAGGAVTTAAKSSAWLGWLLGGLALALAVAFAFMFFFTNVFKSDEDLIKERIDEFIEAYNNGDMDAVMECFDPKTRSAMEATMGIGDALFGSYTGLDIGLGDMFGLSAGINEGDLMTLKDIQFTVPDGAEAVTVNANMTMNVSVMGRSQSMDSPVVINMVKDDGDWYISTFYGKQ